MKSHYRAIIIGGGIVGTSVLYHLTKFGWTDSALIERAELTAGSTWHAAGGFHAINDDHNIAALQGYTIRLYKEIEQESGQSVGLHMTGGLNLAMTRERWEWLKAERSLFQTLDMESHLVTPKEIASLCPIVDASRFHGGLFDPQEGHLDPHGATHAYAGAAKRRGAEIILRNRVTALEARGDGSWSIITEQGTIVAEHVVNAAGLWARKVGRMAGINLPVTPMQHHYLVTDDVPEIVAHGKEMPAVTDLEGFTYLRQERKGVLLGVYERNPRHWHVEGADWDYGMELIPPEIDRIADELAIGFESFPALKNVGIKRWVNGAFTFTPDGNPLIGRVPGLRNFWVACGCMAGFSQGGAIGLALANWMIEGDPGADVFGMDVARYASFAAEDSYLKAMTGQFYARRFVLAYPNEELPAGRPLKTSPCYDALQAEGARFGVNRGMEMPLYFARGQGDFVEIPSPRRSNAHDFVGREVRVTRETASLFETAVYARYEVSGPGAPTWLDWLLSSRLPGIGKVKLAPMLNQAGRLMGDLTVGRMEEDRFWIVGAYYLQEWHMRWFAEHLPDRGVSLRNLSDEWMGFLLSGPRSRDILGLVTDADVSNTAFPFLSCRPLEIGLGEAFVARLAITGELGYEINVKASQQRALYGALMAAGAEFGLGPIGDRAVDSLRLEKSYGIWSTEFAQSYTPAMSGLDRFIAFDKGEFIGRDAALKARDNGPDQMLVTLAIDALDSDATGFEPVWQGEKRVGFVTSGSYGHHVGQSLAMAYVEKTVALERGDLMVSVIGEPRPARILPEPAHDPKGARLRA